MGTVEHFPEYRLVLEECCRVLKPGGKAIIGVPNKFDPFLRPLLVWFLNKLSLYAYGFEKSFSFKAPCSLFSNSASSAGLRPAGSPSLTPAGKTFTPATAGAAGLSYGAGGRPELRLLIHPRLGPLDEQAAARSFFEGIGRSGGAGAVMGLAWQEGKLLKVERQPPLSTPSGKILHLHVQAPAGGGAGSEVGVVRQGGAIPEGGAYPEAERAGQAERKGSR
jgi:SAM-dependent methyltransferase